jgi:hypothetical protein
MCQTYTHRAWCSGHLEPLFDICRLFVFVHTLNSAIEALKAVDEALLVFMVRDINFHELRACQRALMCVVECQDGIVLMYLILLRRNMFIACLCESQLREIQLTIR